MTVISVYNPVFRVATHSPSVTSCSLKRRKTPTHRLHNERCGRNSKKEFMMEGRCGFPLPTLRLGATTQQVRRAAGWLAG